MTSLLKVAAIAAALGVPYAAAQAQQPQGSNQALGCAARAGFGRAYAHYGRHPHHRRY
jgi:opacity protein-like surface antigen